MKNQLHILALMLIACAASGARAQAPYERELKQLTEQRDRALAAATEPINRRYQVALEELLQRASRNKDLETSLKITESLKQLQHDMAASSLRAVGATGKSLQERLLKTTWKWRGGETITFQADHASNSSGWKATWKVTGVNEVTLTFQSNRAAKLLFDDDVGFFIGTDADGSKFHSTIHK